jgi:hypothetical protein
MRENPGNDFARTPQRFGRTRRWLRGSCAALVVVGAANAVQQAGPSEVGGLLVVPSLPLCAAVAGTDPCAGESAAAADSAIPAAAAAAAADLPRWSGNQLALPVDYPRWVAVGSSVGLGYSEAASDHDAFHLVYLAPHAYDQFRAKGTFPEGTMLALEIREPASRVAPARQGTFAGRRLAVEIALKDSKRFPEGWAYFDFGDGRPTASPLKSGGCESCHRKHGATDHVFTQFYSGLRE